MGPAPDQGLGPSRIACGGLGGWTGGGVDGGTAVWDCRVEYAGLSGALDSAPEVTALSPFRRRPLWARTPLRLLPPAAVARPAEPVVLRSSLPRLFRRLRRRSSGRLEERALRTAAVCGSIRSTSALMAFPSALAGAPSMMLRP